MPSYPVHPNLYKVCFFCLFPFFLPPTASNSASVSVAVVGPGFTDDEALPLQGFVGVLLRPSSQLTAPLCNPKIVVLGLTAAGSAGKASETPTVTPLEAAGTVDVGRTGAGDDLEEDGVTHGVAPTWPGPARLAEAAGMGGNGFEGAALPQLPCRFTGDREDCAVEFFSFNILRPAPTVVALDEPGRSPPGPGREG